MSTFGSCDITADVMAVATWTSSGYQNYIWNGTSDRQSPIFVVRVNSSFTITMAHFVDYRKC